MVPILQRELGRWQPSLHRALPTSLGFYRSPCNSSCKSGACVGTRIPWPQLMSHGGLAKQMFAIPHLFLSSTFTNRNRSNLRISGWTQKLTDSHYIKCRGEEGRGRSISRFPSAPCYRSAAQLLVPFHHSNSFRSVDFVSAIYTRKRARQ